MNAPDTLTYEDIADLSRWETVGLWGLPPISCLARAPIFFSLAQASQMDSAALAVLRRHNDWVSAHSEATA